MFAALPMSLVARLPVAAASGMCRRGDNLYVVADDELALGVYDLQGAVTGRILLGSGELPEEPRARKARKPDFEALVSLPDDSLLALGSGSTPQRRGAVLVQFAGPEARASGFSLDALYEALARELPDLNIEGGAVLGDTLWLCSRGNSQRRDDALIALDLAAVRASFARGQPPPPGVVRALLRVSMGVLAGVPLSLTDLTPHRGRLLFTAAAEASPNTYDDGACAGSVLGRMELARDARGPITPEIIGWAPEVKLEGVCAAGASPSEPAFFLVADADQPGAHAPLFRTQLE